MIGLAVHVRVMPQAWALWPVALLLTLVLLSSGAHGSADVAVDGEDALVLGPLYQYLEDPTGSLDLDAVRPSGGFEAADLGSDPNLGYTESVWWIRVPLYSKQGGRRLLVLPFPTLDDVQMVLIERESGRRVAAAQAGDRRPFAERPVVHRDFVFPLDLPAGVPLDLYLRVQTLGSMTVGAVLWEPERFAQANANAQLLIGLYFGILLALFAYNLLLYLSLRETVYLWYVLFVAAMALGQGAWTGVFFAHLWPDSPGWGNLAAVVGFNLTGLFGALFSRAFLDTRRYAPWVDHGMIASAVVFGALAVGAPWWSYQMLAIATSLVGLVFPFIAVAGGVQGLRRGRRSARFFLLAWGILLVGTAMLAARNLGLVPTTVLTRYAMQIGSAMEILLLSFALAERITDLRRGKEVAEESALRAQREMVEALRRTEVELEQRVEARTHELKALNQELSSQRERLEAEARRDPLTGLANRSLLESVLADAMSAAERTDEALAVLFIDLDGFKPVNDVHGHSTGDALLKVVAARIQHGVRTKDTVARFGGDEFVVVIMGPENPRVVIATAERIIARLSQPVDIDALRVQNSASIGVAVFPGDGDRPSLLIRAADQAMYEAKRSGRGCVATTKASATWLSSVAPEQGTARPAA